LRALSENDMTKAASLLFLSSALLGLIGSLTLAGAQGVPAPPSASASVPPPKPAPAQRSSTTPSAKPAAPAKNAVDQSASDIPRPPGSIGAPASAPPASATVANPPGPAAARAKPASPAGVPAKPVGAASTSEKPPATTGAIDKPAAPAIEKPPAPAVETTSTLTTEQRTVLDRISSHLSNVRTLVGKFDQVGPDGNKTTGEFYLQKPGQVRFKYDPPTKTDLVADGQWVAVRDRDLEPPSLYKVSDTPLRFLLADRIDIVRDTNLVGFWAEKDILAVVIEERSIIAGTHRLTVLFGAKDLQLKQWTVTDPQGYDTTVALRNLDPTKRPDPDLFKIN
jgi:outer membrane lipoprotein-sorting protein